MFKILRQSVETGIVTNEFPKTIAEPPDGFRGKPVIDFARCIACDSCATACPTEAISAEVKNQGNSHPEKILSLDYGKCIFCGECETTCPETIHMTKEFQLATANKSDLLTQARFKVDRDGNCNFMEVTVQSSSENQSAEGLGNQLKKKINSIFGRSLHIREVDAGSCNGCEIEITALNNSIYDIERFGIHFVASPRHADMLLITGPVTRNMEIPLRQAYEATPNPKLVIAVGACGISGGIFGKSYTSCGGVDTVIPVDVYIPGCPPRPEAILQGILCAIDRFPEKTLPQKK